MGSDTRAKINFIKLNQQELAAKIALLVSEKKRIIFWKTSPRYFEGKAIDFNISQKKASLIIGNCNIHRRLVGERICFNFSLNDIDYYLRGRISDQDEDHLQMTVELEEHCFRVEKRSRERLITYPIYEVYAYLKYKKTVQTNVVFFHKKEQVNKDFLTEIDNLSKNRIQSLAPDLETEQDEDLVGFRVEDLSHSGLSFFASTQEKENILDSIGEKNFSFVLNFEMNVFNLDEAVVVYKMNYINSQFAGVPMFKIGLNFKPNPLLKKKIEDHAGITVDLFNYQKEFEEFIKNE